MEYKHSPTRRAPWLVDIGSLENLSRLRRTGAAFLSFPLFKTTLQAGVIGTVCGLTMYQERREKREERGSEERREDGTPNLGMCVFFVWLERAGPIHDGEACAV